MPRIPRLYLREYKGHQLWTGARTIGRGGDYNFGSTLLVSQREAQRNYTYRLMRDKRTYRKLRYSVNGERN